MLCELQDHFWNNWVNVENNNFCDKSYLFCEKNTYTFILVIPSFADVHNNLSRSIKYSSKFGASKKVNSQRPDKLLKTKFFEKKGKKANLPMKKKLAFFFLYYRVWRTSRNSLYWSTRSFDIYCTTNKIKDRFCKGKIVVRNFFQERLFLRRKKIVAYFLTIRFINFACIW